MFHCIYAQNDTLAVNTSPNRIYAFRTLYGSILIHTPAIKNTAGADPRGVEFEISKQFTDQATWNKCHCYPRSGFTFSYYDFNTPILGKSFSASYFLEPHFRMSNTASFFVNGGAGLSYLTNPYDSIKNPENHTYSLPINFFLHLDAGCNFRLDKKISVDIGGGFQHNSNGDFSQPNRGINFLSANLALHYATKDNKLPVYPKQHDNSWKKEKVHFDAGIFYSPKAGYSKDWEIERKLLIGTTVQVSKKISQIDALSLAAEVYYDGAFKSIKDNIGVHSSPLIAGVMAGHEFVFYRFIFSQQLGVYIHKNSETYTKLYLVPFTNWYTRWGLLYKFKPHWYGGINVMVREDVADFIDVRVIHRF